MTNLAFITNLTFSEIAIIVVGAIMVFGKDLPSVVMRGMQQLAKLRRAVKEMWNEAGLDQEMRRVRAELDGEIPNLSSPKTLLAEGKAKFTEPIQTWKENLDKEVQDVVPVQKKRPTPSEDNSAKEGEPAGSGDAPSREASEAPDSSRDTHPPA